MKYPYFIAQPNEKFSFCIINAQCFNSTQYITCNVPATLHTLTTLTTYFNESADNS